MPSFLAADAFVREVMEILNSARVEKGMTQAELGTTAGITQSTLSKYFRLELTLNLRQYHQICGALGLSVADVAEQATERTQRR